MTPPKIITGPGTAHDRAGELAEAIKTLIYDQSRRAPLSMALVVGVLHIVADEIITQNRSGN